MPVPVPVPVGKKTGGGLHLGKDNQPSVGHLELKESVGQAGDTQEATGHRIKSSGEMPDLEAENKTSVA